MSTNDQFVQALEEVNGYQKPEEMGMGEWIWGSLQGDFNENRSVGQIGFDMAISLIPVVDTVCDVRDLIANVNHCRKDPNDKVALFFLATTVVGFIPELGTIVKSVLRIVWVYARPLLKHADDITNAGKIAEAIGKAVDNALPKITEYLQHNRIAQWATDNKVPDIYKFVAEKFREGADYIKPAKLKKALDDRLDTLKGVLEKIRRFVPAHIRERIDGMLDLIGQVRESLAASINQFIGPLRMTLKLVAKKLDDHAWRAHVHQTNKGWIAPLSESGAAKLINAKPPKWVTKGKRTKYPSMDMETDELARTKLRYPHHPDINLDTVNTFSRKQGGMRADTLKGSDELGNPLPEEARTLYRVVDPSNEAAGLFWMTKDEFDKLKSRDDWRKYFAVKPNWNQNGWYVKYVIKPEEELKVWRGPAASQKLEGTNYHLEGGYEQIVFYPGSRDAMVKGQPRIDLEKGEVIKSWDGSPDTRVEFTDVTGETIPTKLRAQITDPHIEGPIPTGWGAADYTREEAQRILLLVP